jgi:hypothetical protein
VSPEVPSPQLQPLLDAVTAEIDRRPLDPRALHATLRALLVFLASPEGRTDRNCWTADLFLGLRERWAESLESVPAAYRSILRGIGGGLHDTFYAPEVAAILECTPEQLLSRLEAIVEEPGPGDGS